MFVRSQDKAKARTLLKRFSSHRPRMIRDTLKASSPLFVLAGVILFVGYSVAFFAIDPTRQQALLGVFVPEAFWQRWIGNQTAFIGVSDRLGILAAVLVMVFFAYLAGQLALFALQLGSILSRLERILLATALGLNLLSLATLALGLAGAIRFPYAAGCMLALVGISFTSPRLRSQILNDFSSKRPVPANPAGGPGLSLHWLWSTTPFIALILAGAMLPPIDFDVLEYHLQVPKEWYQQGQVDFLAHNIYGNMPLGAEMHALLAMALIEPLADWWWGAIVGKTMMAIYSLLTAVALFAAGQRFVHRSAGIVAALIFLSLPWTLRITHIGFNEGAVGLYLLLSVYALLLGRNLSPSSITDSNRREPSNPTDIALQNRLFALTGMLAGSAVACKYTSVVFVLAPCAVLVAVVGKPFRWKPLVSFLLMATCMCGLWFGKNWVLTGNPTYPLLYEVFGGESRTPEKDRQWKAAHQVPRDQATPKDAFNQHFTMRQLRQAVQRILLGNEWLSLLVWPFAILAICGPNTRRIALPWCGMALVVWIAWWLTTHRIDRFWAPALPLIVFASGIGFTSISSPRMRSVALGFISLGMFASFLMIELKQPPLSSRRYLVRLAVLRRDAPQETGLVDSRIRKHHRFINQTFKKTDKVLLVGDAAPFDLEIPALYHTCFDACLLEQLLQRPTRVERAQAFRALGITHLVLDWGEIRRYRNSYGFSSFVTPELIQDVLVRQQGLLRQIDISTEPSSVELFEVLAHAP